MVLTGCISKSGCFSDSHCEAVCAGVNGCDCLFPLTMESNLAMVNLSDFFHSALTLSIESLGIILFSEFLVAWQG